MLALLQLNKKNCENGILLIGIKVFQEPSPGLISERKDLEDANNKRKWGCKGWSIIHVIIFVLRKDIFFACLWFWECICLRFGHVSSTLWSIFSKGKMSCRKGFKVLEKYWSKRAKYSFCSDADFFVVYNWREKRLLKSFHARTLASCSQHQIGPI